jgi:GMP synthase (glutamine-hydrolysing)
MLPIYIVNNFGQFNHLILRMFRDLSIDATMVSNSIPPDKIAAECRGLVLGGGPDISRSGNSGEYLHLGLPVLGICLGLHVIAREFDGTVSKGKLGGYGPIDVEIVEHDEILTGYPSRIRVWASHADEVTGLPGRAIRLAGSSVCANEAIAISDLQIYGIQWHPEVSHTENGRYLYENFDRITREQ